MNLRSRSAPGRLVMFARAWHAYLLAVLALSRHPLPVAVQRLADVPRHSGPNLAPRATGRFVWRRLRIGSWRPACLMRSLVLYRLLAQSGVRADIVIGLPERPTNQEAHAWVEVQGVDVGPPPGRNGHKELARYGW